MDTTTNTSTAPRHLTTASPPDVSPADPGIGPAVRQAVARRSFGVLATASAAGRPHAAGVLYGLADGAVWISTLRTSAKARNAAATGRGALTVPVRRLPVGPPATAQLTGPIEVLDLDHPDLRRLTEQGRLEAVTGHGELELDGGCFLRLTPAARVPAYGLGMGVWRFLREPLAAARTAHVHW